MRQRILAHQATEHCIREGRNNAWIWEDKFAELIVSDCINIIKVCGDDAIEKIKELYNLKNI